MQRHGSRRGARAHASRRRGAACLTACAANFATIFLYRCTRGHLLTRRLASGCIRDAGWHRDAFCLLIAQSLTPHGPGRSDGEARTSRRARRRAVPGTPRNPTPRACGVQLQLFRRQTRFELRCTRGAAGCPVRTREAQQALKKGAPTVDRRGAADVSPDDRARSPAAEDGQDRRHTH